MSRRAKTTAKPQDKISSWGGERTIDALLGRADDQSLRWHFSRQEILKKVQTVSGIAELALVDRKTVLREKIAPGSLQAVEFVRDRRLENWKPLVESRDFESPLNMPKSFLRVLYTVKGLRQAMMKSQYDDSAKVVLRHSGLDEKGRWKKG